MTFFRASGKTLPSMQPADASPTKLPTLNRAWIALGANLGHGPQTLKSAMEKLAGWSGGAVGCSSLWRSEPVDCPPGSPDFYNAVMFLEPRPAETPESLLVKLQAMEREFGRKPKVLMNEPRPLDLDLIGFGMETRCTEGLVLPHPRAAVRGFVLAPLCELDATLKLPGWEASAGDLLRRCRDVPERVQES